MDALKNDPTMIAIPYGRYVIYTRRRRGPCSHAECAVTRAAAARRAEAAAGAQVEAGAGPGTVANPGTVGTEEPNNTTRPTVIVANPQYVSREAGDNAN